MGRDTWRHRQLEKERAERGRIPASWRPLGCVLFIVFAAGGYFFAQWFLAANAEANWMPVPRSLIVVPFAPWIPYGLPIKLLVAVVFMVLAFGILNVIYAVFFPPEKSEHDSPPMQR